MFSERSKVYQKHRSLPNNKGSIEADILPSAAAIASFFLHVFKTSFIRKRYKNILLFLIKVLGCKGKSSKNSSKRRS